MRWKSARKPAAATAHDPGLWILYGFTVVALLGFATFGRHPELLARFPSLAGFYGASFRFFAVTQVALAAAVLLRLLIREVGWRWLPSFGVLYGISLGSELMGTGLGIPFGEYHYSPLLAPMWFGLVPVVIPLSWFFMAIPSYALARAALAEPGQGLTRVGLASAILLSWDLSLDPAMSYVTRYWVWGETGVYYGMPWSNLLGWYLTGLALMGALWALRADRWIRQLPLGWMTSFYLANLLLPVGMNAAAGLWGALAAAGVVLALTGLLLRRLIRTPEPHALPATDPSFAGGA